MIINTEFGNFGRDGVISDIMTEYDGIIDSNSTNKGGQTYVPVVVEIGHYSLNFVYRNISKLKIYVFQV